VGDLFQNPKTQTIYKVLGHGTNILDPWFKVERRRVGQQPVIVDGVSKYMFLRLTRIGWEAPNDTQINRNPNPDDVLRRLFGE
jgi:hypothetical protein